MDSGARDNFRSEEMWKQQSSRLRYVSATGNPIPVMGMLKTSAALATFSSSPVEVFFNVSTLDHLNLIDRTGIATLDIDVQSLIQNQISALAREKITVGTETPDAGLNQACSKLCEQFTVFSSLNWAV